MTLDFQAKLKDLQTKLEVEFKDLNLLHLAFVHKSVVNESNDIKESNERLEFLGDAVLELVVTDYLFRQYPDEPEGDLTNWRSALVKGKNLAEVARKLGLGTCLLLSRGEELSGGREKDYILANTMEAFIGAMYLDKGYEEASQFVMRHIVVLLQEIIEQGLHIDAKSHIQELAQEKLNVTPRYELMEESGPDHQKLFIMGIYFKKELQGKGGGSSKQEAEQAAAREALKSLGWNKLH